MTQMYDPIAMRTRLSQAIKDKRMSMRQVGLDAGLSVSAVHGIIKLNRDPGAENLVKICDVIGVTVSWVMYGYNITPEAEEVLHLLQENPAKRGAILQLLRE